MGAKRTSLRESSNNSLPREEKNVSCVEVAVLNISKAPLNRIQYSTKREWDGQ